MPLAPPGHRGVLYHGRALHPVLDAAAAQARDESAIGHFEEKIVNAAVELTQRKVDDLLIPLDPSLTPLQRANELVARLQTDDLAAFETLFARHRALVARTAYGLTGDAHHLTAPAPGVLRACTGTLPQCRASSWMAAATSGSSSRSG